MRQQRWGMHAGWCQRAARMMAAALLACVVSVTLGCQGAPDGTPASEGQLGTSAADARAALLEGKGTLTAADIPPYAGDPVFVVNDNDPSFTEDDLALGAFELYSPLDELGRCGVAVACVGKETMPTEGRGNISAIHPSGWRQRTYDFIEEDGKLYNRSHLIAHALAGEDANELNLITGTHYFNQDVMVNYENEILSYVRKTKNHVLYRVTPIFEGDELVARGVQMEARSVEDKGRGINFNVFVYNVQPGVHIDYATGESWAE